MADYVLTIVAVRNSIDRLLATKVHPLFAGYLSIRQEASRERSDTVQPNFVEFFNSYFALGGGPRPYYRPFWNESQSDKKAWYQANVAGSLSPRSADRIPAFTSVVEIDIGRGTFRLPDDHWERASHSLLYDRKLPACSLAAYLYRNHAFESNGVPDPRLLIQAFRDDFGYSAEDDAEFNTLFSDDSNLFGDYSFAPFQPAEL